MTGSKTSLLSNLVGALGDEKSRGTSSLYHIILSPCNHSVPQSKANKRFSLAVSVTGFRSETKKIKHLFVFYISFENFLLTHAEMSPVFGNFQQSLTYAWHSESYLMW